MDWEPNVRTHSSSLVHSTQSDSFFFSRTTIIAILSLSLSPFHQTKSMGHVCLQFDRFPVRPSLFDYNVNADAITIRVSDSIRPNERHCNTVAHTKKETAVRWELKKKVEEHIQTHRHTHTHTRQSVSQFVKPLWMNRRHKCEREWRRQTTVRM